jgi:hypothetical protein
MRGIRMTNVCCTKVSAYTGDGGWTEYTPALPDGADRLIAECHFYSSHANLVSTVALSESGAACCTQSVWNWRRIFSNVLGRWWGKSRR